jgi:hypothetical protein
MLASLCHSARFRVSSHLPTLSCRPIWTSSINFSPFLHWLWQKHICPSLIHAHPINLATDESAAWKGCSQMQIEITLSLQARWHDRPGAKSLVISSYSGRSRRFEVGFGKKGAKRNPLRDCQSPTGFDHSDAPGLPPQVTCLTRLTSCHALWKVQKDLRWSKHSDLFGCTWKILPCVPCGIMWPCFWKFTFQNRPCLDIWPSPVASDDLCSEFAWQWQGSCFWRAICITCAHQGIVPDHQGRLLSKKHRTTTAPLQYKLL